MDIVRNAISTPDAPSAIGPYSQAMAAGPWVFTSGQIGLDPATGELVPGGITAEAEQVLSNLKAVLAAAGCSPADVVKTTIFLKDMKQFGIVNAIYERVFRADNSAFPARSTVEVARLPKDAQVEIEAIALRRS